MKKPIKRAILALSAALLTLTMSACTLSPKPPKLPEPPAEQVQPEAPSVPDTPPAPEAPAAPEAPSAPEAPDSVTPEPPSYSGEVSGDNLAALESYFNDPQHNGLLRCAYSKPSDTIPYLEFMLYDMGTSVSDQTERQAVWNAFFDGGDPDCDCSKLTREMVMDFFSANFPVNMTESEFNGYWDQMKEQMLYLEEYDAFYLVHGDTMMHDYTFDRAERSSDGTVLVYYNTDLWQYDANGELELHWDQPMCAALTSHPGSGWLMVSNQIVK